MNAVDDLKIRLENVEVCEDDESASFKSDMVLYPLHACIVRGAYVEIPDDPMPPDPCITVNWKNFLINMVCFRVRTLEL